MARKALGKGLRALIPESEPTGDTPGSDAGIASMVDDRGSSGLQAPGAEVAAASSAAASRPGSRDQIRQIPIDSISPNANQPRVDMASQKMEELAQSIREKGLLEPIIVRPVGDRFELVAGERRWRACATAGWHEIPAIVRIVAPGESLELALIENIQREDLNPVEEARAYERLAREFGRTHEEIARRVGRDRSTVTNMLRILRLPPSVLEHVSRGTLSVGHVRVLLGIPEDQQARLANQVAAEGWSVRDTEAHALALIASSGAAKRSRPMRRGQKKPDHIMRLEEELCRHFGSEVRIRMQRKGGRLELQFSDDEDLSRILDILGVVVV
jgi:ParB family chromosome partitioning protein